MPPLYFTDGPRGVARGQSTCFPVTMARGATFDTDLERRIGEVMGIEARAQQCTLSGAVCINLLRHPAWGRAQETYGEDSHHLGEMGAALCEGIQAHNVIATVKVNSPKAVVAVRVAEFDVAGKTGGSAKVETLAVDGGANGARFVGYSMTESERPELTEADDHNPWAQLADLRRRLVEAEGQRDHYARRALEAERQVERLQAEHGELYIEHYGMEVRHIVGCPCGACWHRRLKREESGRPGEEGRDA